MISLIARSSFQPCKTSALSSSWRVTRVSQPLLSLAPSDLRAIALALNTGRLQTPFSASAVQRFLSGRVASEVASALEELGNLGMSPVAIGRTLELLAASRAER